MSKYILMILLGISFSGCCRYPQESALAWAIGHEEAILAYIQEKHGELVAQKKEFTISSAPTQVEVSLTGEHLRLTYPDREPSLVSIDQFDGSFTYTLSGRGNLDNNKNMGTRLPIRIEPSIIVGH